MATNVTHTAKMEFFLWSGSMHIKIVSHPPKIVTTDGMVDSITHMFVNVSPKMKDKKIWGHEGLAILVAVDPLNGAVFKEN